MKKTVLFLLAAITGGSVCAQLPENRTQVMVEKSTATWCVPCGQWGWDLQEQLIADNMVGAKPKAIVMETHGQLSYFHTGVADSMTQSWQGSGIPEWAVNNVRRTEDAIIIKNAVDSITALASDASPAHNYTLSGNKITFNTRTRFWKNVTGTYAIGAYIIEDSAYGEQQGQPGAVAYHRYVLRDHISKNVFGDTIVNGSAWNWQNYAKSYTYYITRTDWVKANLRFMTIVWKRNGSAWNSWEVVNVNTISTIYAAKILGVDNVAVDHLQAYPVPANETIQLSGALTANADAQLSLVNSIGQVVYRKTILYHDGQLAESIDTRGLSSGIYSLIVSSEAGQSVKRIAVVH